MREACRGVLSFFFLIYNMLIIGMLEQPEMSLTAPTHTLEQP